MLLQRCFPTIFSFEYRKQDRGGYFKETVPLVVDENFYFSHLSEETYLKANIKNIEYIEYLFVIFFV